MALDKRELDVVELEDVLDNTGMCFKARISDGIVDYVIIEDNDKDPDLTLLFMEPYIVERFIAFLQAVQAEER